MNAEEKERLKAKMRYRYAVHYTNLSAEDRATKTDETDEEDTATNSEDEPLETEEPTQDKRLDDDPSTDPSDQW